MEREIYIEKAEQLCSRLELVDDVFKKIKNDELMYSEEPFGILWDLKDNMKSVIEEIEKDNKKKVFHVISGSYKMSDDEVVKMDTYLYVSVYDDIPYTKYDEKTLIVPSFVNNTSWDIQEYGSTGITSKNGGFKRVF